MLPLQQFLARIVRMSHWRLWVGRIVIWVAAAITGLTVVSFSWLVDNAILLSSQWREHFPWLPFIVTPGSGVLIAFLTRRHFKGAEGSGIPQVIAAMAGNAPAGIPCTLISLRIAVGKMLLGAAALASGFSAGREGPSVQVGACVMFAFRKLLPRRFVVHPQQLLLAGAAAGIAAAFNTPLAGIVFAVEELGGKIVNRSSSVLLTAIILAGAISISMQGNYTYFGTLSVGSASSYQLLPVLILGVIGGSFGGLFSQLLLLGSRPWPGALGQFRQSHPLWLAGACGFAVALLGFCSDGAVHGSGYAVTRQALSGSVPFTDSYFLEKIFATLLTYIAGIPGGIFAPSLSIGAAIGQDLANLHWFAIGTPTWMALGMVAFLAAVTQAPITAFVIVMEMIDGHSLVVSLMATAMLASMIARIFSKPLYHTLARNYQP